MKEEIVDIFQCADGAKYAVLQTGAIKHLNPTVYTYDAAYSAVYNTPEYKAKSDMLQMLRMGFVQGAHGRRICELQDIGYGNGAFLNHAKQFVSIAYGKDVTDVPVPDGCHRSDEYEQVSVMTFHDCLEHFHCLNFVRDLECETLVVSLPNCPFAKLGRGWFEKEYPHRKPSEHIYHFSSASLDETMRLLNWKTVATSYHETIIRNRYPFNILSMAFKRP